MFMGRTCVAKAVRGPGAKLLLVNMGFFTCHTYGSEIEQLSVLYTDGFFSLVSQNSWSKIDQMIGRKLTILLVES